MSATRSPHGSVEHPQPSTPTGLPHHEEINSIVAEVERKWHLGLTVRGNTWSPSCRAGQQKTDRERCYESIKYLYFKDRQTLTRLLSEFEVNARHKPHAERLGYLWQLLDDGRKMSWPDGRTGPSRPGPTPLQQRLQQVVTPFSKSAAGGPVSAAQSSIFNPSPSAKGGTTKVPLNVENSVSRSMGAFPADAAIEPNLPDTPTAEDETKYTTPPQSPTLQASLRKQDMSSPGEQLLLETLGGRARQSRREKRVSVESTEQERSSKFPRTSGDRKPSVLAKGSFAVPGPPSTGGRVHGQSTSSMTRPSLATSFASTTSSRTDSVFSNYRDNPTMADTSFTTTGTASQTFASQTGQVFHSPGTSSLDEEAAIQMVREIEQSLPPVVKPLENLDLGVEEEEVENQISPGKKMEHHQVKNLAYQGLSMPEMNGKLRDMPIKVRWEFARVALANDLKPEDLLPSEIQSEDYFNYDALWNYFLHHEACRKSPKRGSIKAWTAADNNFEDVQLKASLTFNPSNSGPLFKLNLQPLKMQTSCRFERAFGGDRFLYLELPPFQVSDMPRHLKEQVDHLPERFQEWLLQPKKFLGRRWDAMYVEPLSPLKQTYQRLRTEMRGYKVILFATTGCDIPTKKPGVNPSSRRQEMNLYDLYNWFMPLAHNQRQSFAKIFARVKLGLTTTNAGIVFKPSQIRYVDDICADGTAEDVQYNDINLRWPRDLNKSRIMNDGCARISVGAALQMWRNLQQSGPLPSVFQGRINGAKGVWMLSASADTQDPNHRDVWIEISESQKKFEPHEEDRDMSDKSFDRHRLTFDLHSTVIQPKPYPVYLSFFTILQDRGVPVESLQKLLRDYLDRERDSLLDAMEEPVPLRKWVNNQNALAEERSREDEIPWQAGMPLPLQEKVILLLESGFDPSFAYLSEAIQRLVSKSLRLIRQNVRVPLPHCTYLKGVADPLKILKPGEVHVHFSQSFTDEFSGESFTFLENRALLVARNPALRRSDIQKVRATFKVELAHLRDVVVFPSVGSFPLAGKLQGGDYDGDAFWICWEPDLVDPFKNAPQPLEDPSPAKYGIKVDKRKLSEVLKGKSLRSMKTFLGESFGFVCKPSLLGQTSKLYDRLIYMENSLTSPNARALADIHDLLVDYAKNGYIFDEAAYDAFKKNCLKLPKKIKEPAYEVARKEDLDDQRRATRAKKGKGIRKKKPSYNRDNIIDRLYFETMEPHTIETLEKLRERFDRKVKPFDADLQEPYMREKRDGDKEMQRELGSLIEFLTRVWLHWCELLHAEGEFDDPDTYNGAVDECWAMYRAITPQNTGNPVIRRWGQELLPGAPTHWALLKASALYVKWHQRTAFTLQMAGRELAYIKATKTGNARVVVHKMWANMKPRKIKNVAVEGGARRIEDSSEYESAEEEIGGYGDGKEIKGPG